MSQEKRVNRDLLFKICFIHFANHILKILEINEEIVEISPTELIDLENIKKPRIFNGFLDFAAITKSEKIILFEFKKNTIRTKDLKQAYRYFDHVHCKKKAHVDFIIITISDKGMINKYTDKPITFHPHIIKTKTINKQEDLSTLRDKLEHNNKLNTYDCSLMIALPLFKLEESEAKITEEMCRNIKEKKDCIPNEELDKLTLAMYLNILEYIDEEKQEKLMEMIGLAEKIEGVIAQIRNEGERKGKIEGRIEGKREGEKNIIKKLLKKYSPEEVCTILNIEKTTLTNILKE